MTVLRASSLAAVTIFVWSTSEKPSSTAHARTAWRTRTTSSLAWTGSFSVRVTAIRHLARRRAPVARGGAQDLHGALDVQRRAHPGERHAELDQRDRDGG